MFSNRNKNNDDNKGNDAKPSPPARSTASHPVSRPEGFMDYVQVHERTWGTETYPGRPSLADILAAPVVVFWHTGSQEDPYKITLYQDTGEVEKYIMRLFIGSRYDPPKEKLAQVFKNQKRLVIAGVKIDFREAD